MHFFTMRPADNGSSPVVEGAFEDVGKMRFGISEQEALKLSTPVDIYIKRSGRKWMDFLSMEGGQSTMLISEKILANLKTARLKGYKALPTKLHFPRDKTIDQPWAYFWLLPTGRPYQRKYRLYIGSQRDHQYQFVFASTDLDACRKFRKATYVPYTQSIPMEESWDGKDFNWVTETQVQCPGSGSIYCSRRVLDLAAQEKWTNVIFSPFGAVEGHKIDLQGPWPPASFFSPYEPE